MTTIAIILNPEKEDAIDLVRELVPHLRDKGVTVVIEPDGAAATGLESLSGDPKQLVAADFALVLGGDGTLLRAGRMMSPAGVPMLGVRFGQFGFMTDIEPAKAQAVVDAVLQGDYRVEDRMMLRAEVRRGGKPIMSAAALNDAVISKGPLARMLRLETHVSGKYVSTYQSDGLIVATPTGSTAYSLSAGGPLVTPDLNVLIITPICPHTLTVRPLLISSKNTVEIKVGADSEESVMLTVDGQVGEPLAHGDVVVVGEAEFTAKLIKLGDSTFYDKLQSRLRWGGRFDCES